MVEKEGGIGIWTESGEELVLLLSINDAIVHLHVKRIVKQIVSLAVDGVVLHRYGMFVVVVIVHRPIVGNGAMDETIVATESPEIGITAVGNDEVFGFNRIEY